MTGLFKDAGGRRKIYALLFLFSGLALGAVGLLALWAPDFITSFIVKTVLTLVILAALSSVLFVLTFGSDNDKISQKMVLIIGICAVTLSLILIGETWFDLFEGTFLGKMIISLLGVGLLAGCVMAVWDDFFENKRLKDEHYLD